jgi:alpha-tubulin suppressor-like RCC1 family protein
MALHPSLATQLATRCVFATEVGPVAEVDGMEPVVGNSGAFAAVSRNGSVVAWGEAGFGGDPHGRLRDICGRQAGVHPASGSLEGCRKLVATNGAFAMLKSDGSVVTWGEKLKGGDSTTVSEQLRGGVWGLWSCRGGVFVAVKDDGTVVQWGNPRIMHPLPACGPGPQQLDDVQHIYSSDSSFAAVNADGRVVAWGEGEATPNTPEFDGP